MFTLTRHVSNKNTNILFNSLRLILNEFRIIYKIILLMRDKDFFLPSLLRFVEALLSFKSPPSYPEGPILRLVCRG